MHNKVLAIKIAAIKQQLTVLNAANYTITLVNRKNNNVYLHKNTQQNKALSKDDILQKINKLTNLNIKNFDIYITPKDPDFYYLVVDDLTPENLKILNSYFCTANITQQTSNNNLQAIYKISKSVFISKEQSNALTKHLNKKFGDPNFVGIEHAFRLASFANKKANKCNFYTKLINTNNLNNDITIKSFINKYLVVKQRVQHRTTQEQTRLINDFETAHKLYLKNYRRIKNLAIFKNWNIDESAIEFNTIKDLFFKDKVNKDLLVDLLISNTHEKHKKTDYAKRTVINAINAVNNKTVRYKTA